MGSGIPSPYPDCCLQGIGAQTCGFVFVHPLEHTQTKSSSLGVHSSPLEIISACVKMLGINLGTCFREQQRQTGQRTAPSSSMKPSSNSKNQSSHMQRILPRSHLGGWLLTAWGWAARRLGTGVGTKLGTRKLPRTRRPARGAVLTYREWQRPPLPSRPISSNDSATRNIY